MKKLTLLLTVLAISFSFTTDERSKVVKDMRKTAKKADRVMLYLYNLESHGENADPSIFRTAVDSMDITNSFSTLMDTVANSSGPKAACFEPHHGIVFFDDKNEILAKLYLCVSCQRLEWKNTVISIDSEKVNAYMRSIDFYDIDESFNMRDLKEKFMKK